MKQDNWESLWGLNRYNGLMKQDNWKDCGFE
jgi:hypothetical protein